MLHNTQNEHFSGAIEAAFKSAGHETPLDQAKALLERCWESNRPNAEAALQEFSRIVRSMNPLLVAMLDSGDIHYGFNVVVRGFAHRNAGWWRSAVQKAAGARIGAAHSAARAAKGYSQNPKAVAARRQKKLGEFREKPLVATDAVLIGPKTHRLEIQRRSDIEMRERRSRGVKLVRAEIDLKTGALELISRLPPELARLEINAQRVLLLDMSAEHAAAWCEKHEKYARVGLIWANRCPDPRKTLREQLTAEIVAEVNAAFNGTAKAA